MGHHCINCGAPLVMREIEGRQLEACPHDDFVLWRDPKVATAVVVEDRGGIVLGRRAIEPAYGLWCLPGGFVNDDESPQEAAERECREEIGAAVRVTGLIGVYHVAKQDAPSLIGVGYSARLADGERLEAGAEMLEVGVFQLDALPPLAFPSHRQVVSEFIRSRVPPEAAGPPHAASTAPRAAPPSRERARSTRRRTR
jgi:8-oxo-dGTP diphosphatase